MASTDSAIATISGPGLQGVYIHDPDDPEGTLHQFFYAPSGKTEQAEIASELLEFAGRIRPVAEFGEVQTETLDVEFTVPFDDSWASEVEQARSTWQAFKTYAYRDNRGRTWYGVLRNIKYQDEEHGTTVSFTFERVDFIPIPIPLPVDTFALGV